MQLDPTSLNNSEIMFKLLIGAAEKFGIVGALALFFGFVMCGLLVFTIRKLVSSYESQIKIINDQNKEYQDYFLKNRVTSGQKFLNEDKKGK